ncbi:NADH-quinone oxidoreductase subunit L [Shewanella yunxiaonensis]|uniref:Probable inorganic carbon transporter subunit DabB n=1 Tax=Shewanella yunxiaonensis TaxID=2829809 RepID=A0ABX7YSZ3_9GAMM|nr:MULTISPECIES: NADH-quinone oxidoreductase subunit L [Shewanella]MDF0534115.1 NADH-quinone oxidoreductase subunit L [Shewanella sp. A32]QUN05431.1 NADH-quinone oxidoreductase subunit L [Shewanella yunxiaonensis]
MFSLFLVTPLKLMLLGLVAIIGITIVRYSWVAFAGEADRGRFLRALMMTISAVVLVIISNQLLLFWTAWVSVSLCLHRLILFYPLRPRAQLAAHKKFLLARFSELLLAAAFITLYSEFHTANIHDLMLQVAQAHGGPQLTLAAVLLALVALIKCAQLPMHGWLIQVVEAPTPVSALLHAGIVNLGGILLLFFAPVLAASATASWLLVVLAGVSSTIAGLVSTTRISVKVKLAWSTSSQMGLMLVEIALGLYEMALLHLFAHSFYKSYSFLNSGSTVNHYLAAKLAGEIKPKVRHWSLALTLSALLLLVAQWQFAVMTSMAATVLVWFALSALLVPSVTRWDSGSLPRIIITLLFASALLTLYTTAKHHLAALMGVDAPLNPYADGFVALLFFSLFALSVALQYWPHVHWVKRLFIWLNAGAYLDEWATRLTLKLWPSTSLLQLQHAQWHINAEAKQ